MTLRRGEIYWVDYEPIKGSEQGGLRPALVVQQDLGNRFRSRFSGGFLLLREFLVAHLLFEFQAFVACFVPYPGAFRTRFLICEFTDTRLGGSKIGRQWNMARANQVTTTTFYAIGKTVKAHLRLIIGAGVPKQLLWQQLHRADGGAIAAANTRHFRADHGKICKHQYAIGRFYERYPIGGDGLSGHGSADDQLSSVLRVAAGELDNIGHRRAKSRFDIHGLRNTVSGHRRNA